MQTITDIITNSKETAYGVDVTIDPGWTRANLMSEGLSIYMHSAVSCQIHIENGIYANGNIYYARINFDYLTEEKSWEAKTSTKDIHYLHDSFKYASKTTANKIVDRLTQFLNELLKSNKHILKEADNLYLTQSLNRIDEMIEKKQQELLDLQQVRDRMVKDVSDRMSAI